MKNGRSRIDKKKNKKLAPYCFLISFLTQHVPVISAINRPFSIRYSLPGKTGVVLPVAIPVCRGSESSPACTNARKEINAFSVTAGLAVTVCRMEMPDRKSKNGSFHNDTEPFKCYLSRFHCAHSCSFPNLVDPNAATAVQNSLFE